MIGLVSLLLPHPRHADVNGLYSNVALAGAGGMALLLGAARARAWMLHVAVAIGALLITRAVVLSGDTVSFYSVWFIWIGLYTFYFFGRRAAAGHVTLVAVLYAATLAHDTPSSPIARWLTTVATLIVAGVFIDTLVRHARRQANAAAASAQSMARVAQVAHELAGLSDSGAARLALCRGAVRVTQAQAGGLWEPDHDEMRLRLTASIGTAPAQDTISARDMSNGVARAFATGKPVTRDARAPEFSSGRAAEPNEAAGVRLWQPVVRDQLTVAILELEFEDASALKDPAAVALTDLLAIEVAVTLQRVALLAELEMIARTDELTGLPNRRAWREQLPRQLMQSTRSGAPLSVAMLDLDHFKRFNDTRGHQTGDRLLKEVAVAWNDELRPSDILARYGGEEFALALPACPLKQAQTIVERLRSRVPDEQSCSAGIACWNGSETAADLLDRADHALYRAKAAGRDQVALARPRPNPLPPLRSAEQQSAPA